LREWLEDNKVYFETVAAVLLGIMAVVVGIVAIIVSWQANQIAIEVWVSLMLLLPLEVLGASIRPLKMVRLT